MEKKQLTNGQIASIFCGDNKFQLFLCLFIYNGADLPECGGTGIRMTTNTKDDCRRALCWLLGIESRTECNTEACGDWLMLVNRFNKWKNM